MEAWAPQPAGFTSTRVLVARMVGIRGLARGRDRGNSALHLAFRCQVFSLFYHEAHGFFLLVRRVLVLG